VRRDGTGRFIYDPEYVPPCLQIGASEHLMDLLRRLIEMLDAKSDATARARRVDHKSPGEYVGHEVASFWLLHAIHSSLAPLRHHLLVRRSRPEQLYLELARLAGALCTFGLDSHPRTLPLYDHEELGDCFNALDQHIRAHLEIVMPTRYVSVPLRRETGYFHRGVVADKRCFGRSRWIFGIRSSAGDAEVITRVPQLVKICSWRYLPELVRRAIPGLALEHLPAPPAAISPRADSHYFSISKSGPCWNTLTQTPEVGIYIPDAAFPEAELQLLVMLEG
jgi:type VI secretion system protein ImpJ